MHQNLFSIVKFECFGSETCGCLLVHFITNQSLHTIVYDFFTFIKMDLKKKQKAISWGLIEGFSDLAIRDSPTFSRLSDKSHEGEFGWSLIASVNVARISHSITMIS